HGRRRAVRDLEAPVRLRQRARRARPGAEPGEGLPAARAPLAGLSGAADLAAVELCAGRADAAAVLPAEHTALERRGVRRVERDLRGQLQPHLPALRLALSEISAEAAALVGHGHRRAAD